jgi:hypothetical protein
MVWTIGLIAVLACFLGAAVLGEATDLTPAGQERQRVELEQWEMQQEAERPARVFEAWGLRVVLILALIGAVAVGTLYGMRWALTISPNQQGIFPLLLGRVGQAWVVHDPNRSVSAVTAMGGEPPVTHYLPPGQEQVTGQAQAIQLAAALASGDQAQKRRQNTASALMNASQRMLARPAPPVEKAKWEPGHIEQLLIESGQLEDGYG